MDEEILSVLFERPLPVKPAAATDKSQLAGKSAAILRYARACRMMAFTRAQARIEQ
jgi:hypothetical protein